MNLFRVFIPFALGYYLSYVFRNVNAVIGPDLAVDLGLDASILGLLSSIYLLTFASFQLPLGVLLDKYGPRKTETILLLFAAAGSFLFATAETETGLIIGRGLIGFGVSACLMAAFTAYAMWLPKEKLPTINGWQMSAGGLGALTATVPIEMSLDLIGWRGVFVALGVLSLIAAAAVFLIIPKRTGSNPTSTLRQQIEGIIHVFTSPVFWRITPIALLSQAAFLAVLGLWMGPWLRDVAGFERQEMAQNLMLVAGASVAGYILIGNVTERLSRRGIATSTIAIISMILFVLVQVATLWPPQSMIPVILVLYGFFGSGAILAYAVLSQSFPTELAGRVNTALNLLVFLAAFSAQWGIGIIIDFWPETASGGYAIPGYQTAFGILIALQTLAIVWFFISPARSSRLKD